MLRTKIHIALSAIGVFLGLSAFICFCIVYANIEAGMWALLSGIHAGLTLMLHCHYLKDSLHVNFSRKALQYIGDFGMFGFIAGTALTLFYVFLQIYYGADVLPIDTSIVIRIVWSFMMMKWGGMLYYFTRSYLRTYNDHQLFSEAHIEET
ncbi:heme transporter hrg1-B-like [Leguminivora glycinivorella]|uniref:heme transporter hrg1-B-like n=1 Tax=Leguminivora glycinivorella TaxID=1035111 RepID=UPI00200DEB35|nr:heme transporter hrg1-B-like [Leguminivora glycinivorella]